MGCFRAALLLSCVVLTSANNVSYGSGSVDMNTSLLQGVDFFALTPFDHEGKPSTYEGAVFELLLDVTLAATDQNETFEVTIDLAQISDSDVIINGNDVSIDVGPMLGAYRTHTYGYGIGLLHLTIDLHSNQSYGTGRNDSNDTEAYTVYIRIPMQIMEGDNSHELKFKAIVDVDSTVNVSTVSIYHVGPMLRFDSNVTPWPEIEAGDVVDFLFGFDHVWSSTENVTKCSISIEVSMEARVAAIKDSANVTVSGGAVVAVDRQTATSLYHSLDAGLLLSDILEVSFTLHTTNELLMNDAVTVRVKLEYFNKYGMKFHRSWPITLTTKSLKLTAHNSNTDMPLKFPVGLTHTIRKTFGMPKGKLQAFNFFADFQSPVLSSIPILFTQAKVLASNAIKLSDNKSQYSSSDFKHLAVNSSERKRRDLDGARTKRATGSSLKVALDFGNLINAGGVSGEQVTVKPLYWLSWTWVVIVVCCVKIFSTSSSRQMFASGVVALLQHITFVVGDVTSGGPFTVTAGMRFLTGVLFMTSTVGSIDKPMLSLNKTVHVENSIDVPSIVRFTVTVDHVGDNVTAADVILKDGSEMFDILWHNDYVGPPRTDLNIVNDRLITWNKPTLDANESMLLSYKAKPRTNTDGDALLPIGKSYYNSTLLYKYGVGGATSALLVASVCIERVDVTVSNLAYDYGFTVLALLCGIILGVLIVVLIIFIIWKVRRCLPFTTVRPYSAIDHNTRTSSFTSLAESKIQESGQGLVTKSKGGRRGMSTIKDLSSVSATDSLVVIYSMKDKMQIYRELDNLDILSTIHIDEKIEDEREQAMNDGATLLVQSLTKNGDIDKQTENKCLQKFNKDLNDLDKQLDKDFNIDLEHILDKLSEKNKDKIGDILEKQKEETDSMEQKILHLSPKEQDDVKELLSQQQQTEMGELTYILKLEQNEETEKLRKEYSIRKRMGVKGLQQALMDDVEKTGKLSSVQADWLIKGHMKNQAALEKLYDEEISRQRMVLEEKLARRRGLAEHNEVQDDLQSEVLNALATHQLQTIQRAKKEHVLYDGEAEKLIEQIQEQMVSAKERMDHDRAKQEKALHKKLSERKKQRLKEKAKEHQQELAELDRKHKSEQTDGALDPVSMLESRQTLLSHQRTEMSEVENEIDQEHVEELRNLREDIAEETRQELEDEKDKIVTHLRNKGMDDDQLNKILRKHAKELDQLKKTQTEEKQRQEENLKKKLAQKRSEWDRRKEEEKQEQHTLREHESNIVRKLMDNQVAMSEVDRDKILQEHEKQMVTLENSLTLNKLKQKRMLEEKVAKKRALQMEKLQKKQLVEVKKQKRKQDEDSELDEDQMHDKEINMMKKHAEQRIAILHGEKIEIEQEMDDIRTEMVKERANALKTQEVKLGALMASLQLEKAKEMAKIEEQQKAIHNLKSNLMDDLNERGVLSDPQCKQVVERHQEEQEKLNQTLELQRSKQEKKLRQRLNQKMEEREKLLFHQHQEETEEVQSVKQEAPGRPQSSRHGDGIDKEQEQKRRKLTTRLSSGNKLRQVALKHKHMVEMEQFRNRMETEISQTLQELRRQSEMKRMEMIQKQELQFMNGLVRIGKFKLQELDNVIKLMFPTKTEEERQRLMQQLCEGYEPQPESEAEKSPERQKPGFVRSRSSLETRTIKTVLGNVEDQVQTEQKKGKRKSALKKKQLPQIRALTEENIYGMDDLMDRPEPLGRSYSPNYQSDQDSYGRMTNARQYKNDQALYGRTENKQYRAGQEGYGRQYREEPGAYRRMADKKQYHDDQDEYGRGGDNRHYRDEYNEYGRLGDNKQYREEYDEYSRLGDNKQYREKYDEYGRLGDNKQYRSDQDRYGRLADDRRYRNDDDAYNRMDEPKQYHDPGSYNRMTHSRSHDKELDHYGRMPPTKLPPMQVNKKKAKAKMTTVYSDDDDF